MRLWVNCLLNSPIDLTLFTDLLVYCLSSRCCFRALMRSRVFWLIRAICFSSRFISFTVSLNSLRKFYFILRALWLSYLTYVMCAFSYLADSYCSIRRINLLFCLLKGDARDGDWVSSPDGLGGKFFGSKVSCDFITFKRSPLFPVSPSVVWTPAAAVGVLSALLLRLLLFPPKP